jgi:hypothetical protein
MTTLARQMCDNNFTPNATVIAKNTDFEDFIFEYSKNNIAMLNIFIKDPFYSKIKREEQMTIVSFIGNAGGLMGLCLGLSMISIFEMFYYSVQFLLKALK